MFTRCLPYVYHGILYSFYRNDPPRPPEPTQVPAATTGGGLNSTPSRTATGEATAKKAKAPRFVGSPWLSHLQIMVITIVIWLVVWDMFFFPYIGLGTIIPTDYTTNHL